MLYHVSKTHGLKTLLPQISSHGKAYVYAVDNLVTGLLFGAKQDDFDFIIDTDENGTPQIFECYPDAFKIRYQGENCSVYKLADTGFLRGQTGWDAELVCPGPVKVQEEIVIPDLFSALRQAVKDGALHLYPYSSDIVYKAKISEHIVDRLIRFEVLDQKNPDERFEKYYSRIIHLLKEAISGEYL